MDVYLPEIKVEKKQSYMDIKSATIASLKDAKNNFKDFDDSFSMEEASQNTAG